MEQRVKILSYEQVPSVARALDSDIRRRMLEVLFDKPLSVSQLAKSLSIPQSTCTVNLQILRDAGLIQAASDNARLLTTTIEEVVIPLRGGEPTPETRVIEVDMPIGLYSAYEVHAPCGIVSEDKIIGFLDIPDSFLDTHRASAQMIWLSNGYLEYPFPMSASTVPQGKRVKALVVTAEVCSEYPDYKLDWPSDITVWISGVEIGTWTSPGDMGGTRGRLTPAWWPVRATQYGFKKTWKIADDGCYIDGIKVSDVTVSAVPLNHNLVVRIGIKEHAEHKGGLNLFGRKFGNYEHDLVLRMELDEAGSVV